LPARLAADLEGDADVLEAVADLAVDAESAAGGHSALGLRVDLVQDDLAGGRDVDDGGRQAGGERVQEVLGGVRALVGAEQDGRLAGVDLERGGARDVLAAGRVEALDGRAVVRAADPRVARAETEA